MLAYATTQSERPRAKRTDHETAIRMAEVLIRNERRGYPTTVDDLRAEDFSETEITMHMPTARRIARETTADRDVDQCAAEYDRAGRIAEGARIMADMIRTGEGVIFAKLRESGFATRELGDLYPDMIAQTCLILAGKAAPAGAH